MRKVFHILLLCALAGCNPAERFSILEAGMPALDGTRSVHGRLVVENSSVRDLMIESAAVTFRYKGKELAAARLMRPVELPAGVTSWVRYDFAIENTSPANLYTLQTRMLTVPGQITVDVKGYVRWGGMRKKVTMEGIPALDIVLASGSRGSK